jgi:hypothetical protein
MRDSVAPMSHLLRVVWDTAHDAANLCCGENMAFDAQKMDCL